MPLTPRDEFLATLSKPCRLLGLDVGKKTIGLALSDNLWMVASPIETLKRTQFTKDAEALIAFVKEEDVKGLIIGLPLHSDGGISPMSQSVTQFARNLDKLYPIPTLLWDERMSTRAATNALIHSDHTPSKRKEVVDKIAASLILQTAMDWLNQQ